MRKGCWDCCIKHLSKAMVVSSEVHLGYPQHAALVIGNLSEAEDEVAAFDLTLAEDIRSLRLKYMDNFAYDITEEVFKLFERALVSKLTEKDKVPAAKDNILP